MFFFQHSIAKLVCDSSLIIAGWLRTCFCVAFLCWGSKATNTGLVHMGEVAASAGNNFSPEVWDVLLSQQTQRRRG